MRATLLLGVVAQNISTAHGVWSSYQDRNVQVRVLAEELVYPSKCQEVQYRTDLES